MTKKARAGLPRAVHGQTQPSPTPTADAIVVLWMGGGMAHTETFDPKRYTPFEKGLESKAVLSTFPAIDTTVDGVKLSKGLERIARVMDRATLIRSSVAANPATSCGSRQELKMLG